ncbi:helix-turn-helix domain-containing protein, partial [Acutalibacter intestini]
MGHYFSHLSKTDRYKLEAALLAGEKPQAIADRLHVHVSTIYREKKRARMVQLTTDLVEVDRYNPDEA